MDLARLIDLECQLVRDEEALRAGRAAELAQRDRPIGEEALARLGLGAAEARERVAGDDAAPRRALATEWIDRMRERAKGLPGEATEKGWRVAGVLLGVIGGAFGVSTAKVVLHYDGREPVNVFHFLAVFVLLQVFLLAVMVLTVGFQATFGAGEALGWMQRLIVRLGRTRFVERLLGIAGVRGSSGEASATLGALRGRRRLYADVERWMLFALTQRFGLWFNVCALVTCLALILFTDLAFGWSTTLDAGAAETERLVRGLAVPWSWISDRLVPGSDVVAASRWVRMERRFDGGGAVAEAVPLARQWWRFMVAALVAYGLLPRLGAWAFGLWRWRRALAAVTLDHVAFQHLYERLLPPSADWERPAPETVGGPAAAQAPPAAPARSPSRAARPRTEPKSREPARGVLAVGWGRIGASGEALGAAAARRFGLPLAGTADAGGPDLGRDRACLALAASAKPARIAVFVEAGVQPTREVLEFLRELREAAGAQASIGLIVVQARGAASFEDAPDDEREPWRLRLAAAGDLYLAVERLAGAP